MSVTRKNHLDGLALSLLLACCLFWGFQQVLVKATVPQMAPVFQAWLRFALAAALLWAWCRWRGVALFQRDGALGWGLLAGALFAGEFVCIYVGLQHTTASRLTVFLYTSPFWVALILPRFLPTERLRRVQWVGLVLAFCGVLAALGERLGAGRGGAMAGRSARADGRPDVGPDHRRAAQHPAGPGGAGEAVVLPDRAVGGPAAAGVVGPGRALGLATQHVRPRFGGHPGCGGGLCQLPDLDVGARPLSRHQGVGLCLPDTGVRIGRGSGLAGRAGDARPDRRPGPGGHGHRAGQPALKRRPAGAQAGSAPVRPGGPQRAGPQSRHTSPGRPHWPWHLC